MNRSLLEDSPWPHRSFWDGFKQVKGFPNGDAKPNQEEKINK